MTKFGVVISKNFHFPKGTVVEITTTEEGFYVVHYKKPGMGLAVYTKSLDFIKNDIKILDSDMANILFKK